MLDALLSLFPNILYDAHKPVASGMGGGVIVTPATTVSSMIFWTPTADAPIHRRGVTIKVEIKRGSERLNAITRSGLWYESHERREDESLHQKLRRSMLEKERSIASSRSRLKRRYLIFQPRQDHISRSVFRT